MSRPPSSRVLDIDLELRTLYARYEQLMQERSVLTRPPVAPLPPAAAHPPVVFPPDREASRVSVQAVLLTLGGLLLGVASIVFTLVAWSRLGIGGRAAVLGAVTVVALGVPVGLLRRRLAATAETVAALALLLVLLDAYLLRRLDLLGLGGSSPALYAGAVLGLVALAWSLYGLALPGLRGIRPTALALAQPALPLLAGRGGALWVAGALVGVAALDLLPRDRVLRVVAGVGGGLAWGGAVLTLLPPAYAEPVGAVAVVLLGLAGAVAVLGALTGVLGGAREVGLAAGVLAGAAAVVAPPRAVLDGVDGGTVLVVTAVGLGVAALPWRSLGLRVAAGALLLPGGLAALAGAVAAAAVPGATAVAPWTGVAAPDLPGLPRLLVAVAVLAAAGVALILPVRAGAVLGAVGVIALVAPVAFALPYAVTIALLAALTLAAAALAARAPAARAPAGPAPAGPAPALRRAGRVLGGSLVAAAGLGGLTVAWALATEPATLTVLAGLALAAPALAGTATARATRVGAAAVTVAALGAEAAAVPLAAGLPVAAAGYGLLLVAAAATLAAALTRTRPESAALELTGAAVALAGVVVASRDTGTAAGAVTVLGAILGGAALRPDRRPLAWYAALSVQVAVWIWLAGHGVGTPEAYTLPLAAVLLALGAYRRRHDTTLSSWVAYGPGLAAALLPSLFLAVGGSGTVRPLLLGGGALVVLLTGARARLQAPLALAAGTLALLALDQLGPALAEVAADLPRWLPPALGGALLLVLGSTYERRRADLRKARTAFTRLV